MPVAPAAIGLLVVGDEILSGKRQDKHFARIVSMLAERGMELAWARFVGDDAELIADALSWAIDRGDAVLSCGGIGATPDDQTRQGAALATGRAIQRHPDAAALIEHHYGEAAHPNRLKMADFPADAALIPNPINHVAGFSVGHCYFVPGFPEMAWPMLAWVLDGPLAVMHDLDPPVEYRLRVLGGAGEGDLLHIMEAVLASWPAVRLSSLPTRGSPERPRQIEFGIKGPGASAVPAFEYLRARLAERDDLRLEDLAVP